MLASKEQSPMKDSFFDWVREGVKQSVLLGISDAAEHIGTPAESDQLNARLVAAFTDGRLITEQEKARSGRTRRKALGRSLSTIMQEEQQES
jgi:hypothetical protein